MARLLLTTALAATSADVAAAEVVDRIVSLVGEDVITESEVHFERALMARDVSPLPPFEQSLDALTLLEHHRALWRLAGDLPLLRPEARELEDRIDALRASFPDNAAWRDFLARWGYTSESLEIYVLNRMIVERYVNRSIGLAVEAERGGDAEAYLKAYEDWMGDQLAAVRIRRID